MQNWRGGRVRGPARSRYRRETKMFKKNITLVLTGAGLAAVAMVAIAANTVTLNGTTYSCPNRCVVTTYPNGGWMVRDSGGGPVTVLESEPVID